MIDSSDSAFIVYEIKEGVDCRYVHKKNMQMQEHFEKFVLAKKNHSLSHE